MLTIASRRGLWQFAVAMSPVKAVQMSKNLLIFESSTNEGQQAPITDVFPAHPPELAREMVTVSHFNLKSVKELVEARPALAKASWDWGFGDWETALGAASHMGNRAIAEYLIANGAGLSLFSAAMLGQ